MKVYLFFYKLDKADKDEHCRSAIDAGGINKAIYLMNQSGVKAFNAYVVDLDEQEPRAKPINFNEIKKYLWTKEEALKSGGTKSDD
jgi:hypothetical protein